MITFSGIWNHNLFGYLKSFIYSRSCSSKPIFFLVWNTKRDVLMVVVQDGVWTVNLLLTSSDLSALGYTTLVSHGEQNHYMNNGDIQWSRSLICFSHDLLSFQDRWAALQTQEVIFELVKTVLGAPTHSKLRCQSSLVILVISYSSVFSDFLALMRCVCELCRCLSGSRDHI